MTKRTTASLLAVALLLAATATSAGAAAALGGASNAQTDTGTDRAGGVNVTVGQQLSTVMVATDGDVRHEVEETSFELRFEGVGDDERAAAVAERAEELARRAIAIRDDYENATRAHETGEISDSEYAARIAALNARADDLAESVRRLRGRAAGVSAIELRAEGLTAADLRAIDERLDAVSGTGAAALLQRFTGRTRGEVRIESRDGLSIEVQGDDGEVSREIERQRDRDTNITVAQADALETAREALGSPPGGNWTLERATVHEDDGYYRFRFALTGANATGKAEVRVDGSSGEVFRLETEIEAHEHDDERGEGEDRERGDEGDRDDAREHDRKELALLVAHGTPGPNETVTLLALARGEPVADAAVTLNGEPVGTTGEDGTLTVRLPDGKAQLRVESGDAEGELEFEFDETEREHRELRRHFRARATVEDGTVELALAYDGAPVDGATVSVGDREVGTTGEDGTVTFDAAGYEEFDVTVRKGAFGADLAFERRDGSLHLVEVEFDDVHEDDREADEGHEDERETDEGDDDEHETESRLDGDLEIHVVEGTPAPDSKVVLAVTSDGEPVANAVVVVNDERVGRTDERGRIALGLPSADRVEVVAELEDASGVRRFEFDRETSADEPLDGDLEINVVEGTPAPGAKILLAVTHGDGPVAGAVVVANDDVVGRTDEHGRIALWLPSADRVDVVAEFEDARGERRFEFDGVTTDSGESDDGDDGR